MGVGDLTFTMGSQDWGLKFLSKDKVGVGYNTYRRREKRRGSTPTVNRRLGPCRRPISVGVKTQDESKGGRLVSVEWVSLVIDKTFGKGVVVRSETLTFSFFVAFSVFRSECQKSSFVLQRFQYVGVTPVCFCRPSWWGCGGRQEVTLRSKGKESVVDTYRNTLECSSTRVLFKK